MTVRTDALPPLAELPGHAGFWKRAAVRWTGERLIWALLSAVVVGVAIVPLLKVFDAALFRETRIGLADVRSLAAVLDVYTSSEYLGYLASTLILAAIVTVLAVILGVAMALLVARADIPAKGSFDLLIIMPLFMSPFTGMMAWIALGSEKSGFINVFLRSLFEPLIGAPFTLVNIWSYGGIVWVMVIFFCPFAYLFTVGNLRGMDAALEEAARTTGATAIQTLTRVTLPLAAPAILGAALLIFILSAEMYTIPGAIGSNIGFTTLPWKVYRDINGIPVRLAHAAASGTLLLFVTCLGVWLQRRLTRQTASFATITGKGVRSRLIPLGAWKIPALTLLGCYVLAADILPFGGLLMSSLMRFSAPAITADVFTFNNFAEFFNLQHMVDSLGNTVLLAVLSAAAFLAIGLMISYMEVRRPSIPTKLLAFLGILPVAVPGIVYGIGLMWTFLRTPLYAVGEAPVGIEQTGEAVFNRIWTLLHVPCINIPGFTGTAELPIGLTLTGPRFSDRRLLRTAAAVASVFPATGIELG